MQDLFRWQGYSWMLCLYCFISLVVFVVHSSPVCHWDTSCCCFALLVVACISMRLLRSGTVKEEPGLESRAVVLGRSWVVQELDRLRCGSTAVWDPSDQFVVYHTWLGLPTATPKTPLCGGFNLLLSLLLCCFFCHVRAHFISFNSLLL